MRINYQNIGLNNWVGDDCAKSLNGQSGRSHGFVCESSNATVLPNCDKGLECDVELSDTISTTGSCSNASTPTMKSFKFLSLLTDILLLYYFV